MLTIRCCLASIFCLATVILFGCAPILNPDSKSQYVNALNLENYTAYGDLHIMGTNVTNYLRVNGVLKAQNSYFKHVYINGNSDIVNTVINGDFNANGKTTLSKVSVLDTFVNNGTLIAKNSYIQKPFVVDGASTIHLYNSMVQDIYVKPSKNVTTIEVHGGTQVQGNITFEQGRGRVFIDQLSKVHGSILGGQTEHEYIDVKIK